MKATIPACFKAYDIRGKVPDELDEPMARRIGYGLATLLKMKKVVVGYDIRLTGLSLTKALITGLLQGGAEVLEKGICGTEEIYHAVFSMEESGVDGGVIVTASHNPADYNGMKIVTKGARPLTDDSGLQELGVFAGGDSELIVSPAPEKRTKLADKGAYIDHLLGYVDVDTLTPLTIVANCGNGCAGVVLKELAARLPFTFHILHERPDGTFPNGVPNPLLPDNREETAQAVIAHKADLGIAWDGDFDRCFFWDEKGRFVEGYYLVALLAKEILKGSPGEKILHDPRLIWNTVEQVKDAAGIPVMTRTGHAFIKKRMREERAIYGGEMSAHHYFRDFGYCDSGMIPWLLVASLLGREKKPLSAFVADMIRAYPVSGEINSTVADADAAIERIKARYSDGKMDFTDGVSISYPAFRCNIRKSNTEPLLRLNVESRGDRALLQEKTAELIGLIRKG
ncbi:MAG: phosphomannomutase [Desulfobacterales bacterium]|nr:MAG: phosphomannomutase [Desulfobacterales bacterium]